MIVLGQLARICGAARQSCRYPTRRPTGPLHSVLTKRQPCANSSGFFTRPVVAGPVSLCPPDGPSRPHRVDSGSVESGSLFGQDHRQMSLHSWSFFLSTPVDDDGKQCSITSRLVVPVSRGIRGQLLERAAAPMQCRLRLLERPRRMMRQCTRRKPWRPSEVEVGRVLFGAAIVTLRMLATVTCSNPARRSPTGSRRLA